MAGSALLFSGMVVRSLTLLPTLICDLLVGGWFYFPGGSEKAARPADI